MPAEDLDSDFYTYNDKLTNDFRWGEFWSGDVKLGFKSIQPPIKYFESIFKMAEELQKVRDYIGSPIHITSGYRTRAWNKHEGGVDQPGKLSYHCQGRAVDIRIYGMTPYDLAIYVSRLTDFNGYGVNISKNFVHCDMRPKFYVFKY